MTARKSTQWTDSGEFRRRLCFAATRKAVLVMLLAMLALHEAATAGPADVPRIGILALGPTGPRSPMVAVEQSLRELGYIEGRNVVFERRIAGGAPEKLQSLAAELVRLDVDVLLAFTNVAALAAKSATTTIPIVVWGAKGAIENGLVSSLSKPGGNITGVESLAPEVDAKRIQILKELVPGLRRVAVLFNADDQGAVPPLKYTRDAGKQLGIDIYELPVRRRDDLEPALTAAISKPLGGLLTVADDLTVVNWPMIATLANRHQVPTICQIRRSVVEGCLVSYGTPLSEFNGRAAAQVDRILRGAKASDLPFERALRFELVINMTTARLLGITVPSSILLQADEVVR